MDDDADLLDGVRDSGVCKGEEMKISRHRVLVELLKESGMSEERFVALAESILASYPERDRLILNSRLGDRPETLDQIGRQLGLTRERIRQIEFKTCCKIRRAIRWISARPMSSEERNAIERRGHKTLAKTGNLAAVVWTEEDDVDETV